MSKPTKTVDITGMPLGPFQTNCWLLTKPAGTAVIDPGSEPDRLIQYIRKHHLNISVYLITHGHVDHLSALHELHAAFPAPVCMHRADAAWAFGPINALPPHYEQPTPPAEELTYIDSTSTFAAPADDFTVIETPGHTPGGVCFYSERERVLITGDTLFCGSAGRTDLTGGSPEQLRASLHILAQLPDETRVYAGHGPVTSIGRERRSNVYFTG